MTGQSDQTTERILQVKAFDGSITAAWITAPCGHRAYFDGDYSYRCSACFCVIGSVGMPDECRELAND